MKRRLAWALLMGSTISLVVCDPSAAETESVRALLQTARAQAKQGNHSQAAEILDKAKMLAPNSEDVLSDFAKNSLLAGDPVGAINVLEPLTRMHPKVAEYPYLLGVAQLQIKEFAPSVDSLEQSLELEPQRALTLIALGITLISQKRFDEAKQALDRALEIEPENAEALAVAAEAAEGLGELELAETQANRVLALVGGHAGASYVLGRVRMQQGQFAEAVEWFQKVLQLAPNSPRTYYQLSLAYARLGDLEKSREYRELHQASRSQEVEDIEKMRLRAGLKQGGMRP